MHRVLILFALFAAVLLRGAEPEGVSLEAATDREFYLADSKQKVYVEVKVGAATATAGGGVRNVVLVLDRSGSMAGGPIQALREAVATSLTLLGEKDLVSVVVFGSEVETLIEAKPRGEVENLAGKLAQLEPAGGAAMYDALNQGAAQLRRHFDPAVSNHMVLITDGKPTKGPREVDDFKRLAEVFAREQITLSAIGVGDAFNEDLLATLARVSNGHFRYAAQPSQLSELLQLELAPAGTLIGRDIVLTADFADNCETLESYGWVPATLQDDTATFRFPYLFAGQNLSVLLGAKMEHRSHSYRGLKLHVTWTGVEDGKPHELKKDVDFDVDASQQAVRTSGNPAVIRTMVGTVISKGLQDAIEAIDKGNFKRAQRALRNARSDALDLNYDIEDPQAAKAIAQLDAYLAEVKTRGLNQLDRKVLRSGLNNQFQTPTADDGDKR